MQYEINKWIFKNTLKKLVNVFKIVQFLIFANIYIIHLEIWLNKILPYHAFKIFLWSIVDKENGIKLDYLLF